MNAPSRSFWIKYFLFGILIFSLFSCTKKTDRGPLEIKYDRDRCSECGMAISDNRFAAQIRGGKDHAYHAHKFDDVGCALKFSKKQSWFKDAETEFFVRDYEKDKWLEAGKAQYKKVKASPMGYGYSAHENGDDKSMNYEAVNKALGE